MNKKQQKEYEDFKDNQFRIIEVHFSRCMNRCHNKLMELELQEVKK